MGFTKEQVQFINSEVLKAAKGLAYTVKADAPSTEQALFNSPSLVVWNGASDNTIYQDETVNWAFRAWHDALHLESGLGFTVAEEIELGRLQASKIGSDFLAELIFCEVAGQAAHYEATGEFVADQVGFTVNWMRSKGFIK